tara:strand:+ start:2500 stop:4329 length:1830 start_codon:yes stop_codon:yes gene_type:complete
MTSNEAFVGAGQSVTFIPEANIYLKDCANTTGETWTIIDNFDGDVVLIPKLYVGCVAKVELEGGNLVGYFTIADNTQNSLIFNESIHGSDLDDLDVTILAYGAPTPSLVTSSDNTADGGAIATVTISDGGASGSGANYTNVKLEGSKMGTGAIATITVGGSGAITGVTITTGGDGYVSGEILLLGSAVSGVPTLTSAGTGADGILLVNAIETDGTTLLSDSWLGLINTFSPPSVEVTLNQMNLALGNTRNFTHQYKGAETVSGASLDINMNNGSWLYYALGGISVSQGGTASSVELTHALTTTATELTYINTTTSEIVRTVKGGSTSITSVSCPPVKTPANFKKRNGDILTYTFTELNGDSLPSFAIDMSHEKVSSGGKIDALTPTENMWAKVATGCQVNSLTMNFNEGEELKCTVDLVSKTLFDAPAGYFPQRNIDAVSNLHNFSSTKEDNYPFMYSDGGIKIFGQTFARIKAGSLAIANNLTPHRYIGNYDRRSISHHSPAQRTYDLNFTMLITDTQIWDELRGTDEFDTTGASNGGIIELNFTKGVGTGPTGTLSSIALQFSDYIIDSVSVPFPDDKSALEVEVTMKARTLTDCKYSGKWEIINTK